ncbi:MAG: DNA repair protein RecO [Clostridia bacterium]
MASIVTHGTVLRFANYRDHDRMLSVLSPEYGRLEVLSRGCRRPRSPLMPASELFVNGEFVLYQNADRYTLTSCSLTDTFYPLRLEPYRLTCASYMAALCHAASQPGDTAEALYVLLLKGLYRLTYDAQIDALGFTTAFLLVFADLIGYRPRLTRCAHCRTPLDTSAGGRMDVAAGGLCCERCSSRETIPLTAEQIVWMRETLRVGLPEQSETDAGILFEMLRRYVESRLDLSIKVSRLLP